MREPESDSGFELIEKLQQVCEAHHIHDSGGNMASMAVQGRVPVPPNVYSAGEDLTSVSSEYTVLPSVRPLVQGIRDGSSRFPQIGELIMLKVPFIPLGPASVKTQNCFTLPTKHTYHFVVVCDAVLNERAFGPQTWTMKVLICRTFSHVHDPVGYVESLPFLLKAALVPLPWAPRRRRPTPELSETTAQAPVHTGRYIPRRPVWVIPDQVRVHMGDNGVYKSFTPPALISQQTLRDLSTYSELALHNSMLPRKEHLPQLPPLNIHCFRDNDPENHNHWHEEETYSMDLFMAIAPRHPWSTAERVRRREEQVQRVEEWIEKVEAELWRPLNCFDF